MKEYAVKILLTEETEAELIALTEMYNNYPGKEGAYPFRGDTPGKVMEVVLNFGTATTIMDLIRNHKRMLEREMERDAEK